MASDWARILAMLEGGIFLDCDVKLLGPLDSLLSMHGFITIGAPQNGGAPRHLNMAICGSRPDNPFFVGLNRSFQKLPLAKLAAENRGHAAGPGHVTAFFESIYGAVTEDMVWERKSTPHITILPKVEFQPYNWDETPLPAPFDARTLGVHLWEKSWVGKSLAFRTLRKRFLFDLGFHRGEGLSYLRQTYGIDSSWEVFCFEPNSTCRESLFQAGVTAMPFAAWTKAGPALLQREARHLNGPEDGQGSHLSEIDLNLDCRGAAAEEVWSVNFSAFLRSVISTAGNAAFVIVKMDIEGAEFSLLREMISDGSINLINVLHVEFHHRLMPNEDLITTNFLKSELRKHVTLVEHW
jgi:FkbM family methyltransferase